MGHRFILGPRPRLDLPDRRATTPRATDSERGPRHRHLLNGVIAGGLVLQATGMLGLLTVLFLTFRAGRPLDKNKGFKQIVPLLSVTALALSLA